MKRIIKAFKNTGYELFHVGGSVRDEIMGKKSNDYDFSTNALPEQMKNLACVFEIPIRYTDNSINHGTIIFRENNIDYEITTYRKDVATDGRNATIQFANTVEEDLSRRDFTMNAMAKCAYTGKLIDPYMGQEDITNKIIRFVGDGWTRIEEDNLRLLRGYRFLSQFSKGWEFIDDFMYSKIDKYIFLVNKNLSKERIRTEIMKLMAGNPAFALYHMNNLLVDFFFNDLIFTLKECGRYHAESIRIHSYLSLVNATRLSKDPLVRLAAFLHDSGKTKITETNERNQIVFTNHETVGAIAVKEWMKDMKFSNLDIERVYKIIINHMRIHDISEKDSSNRTIKRFMKNIDFDENLLDDILTISKADTFANFANTINNTEYNSNVISFINKWEEIKRNENCFKISDLSISGKDLIIDYGFKQGKEIGDILKEIFNLIEEGKLENYKLDIYDYLDRKSY